MSDYQAIYLASDRLGEPIKALSGLTLTPLVQAILPGERVTQGIRVSPDGTLLLNLGSNLSYLYNLATGERIGSFTTTGTVYDGDISPSNEYAVVATSNGAFVFSSADWNAAATIYQSGQNARTARFRPGLTNRLFVGSTAIEYFNEYAVPSTTPLGPTIFADGAGCTWGTFSEDGTRYATVMTATPRLRVYDTFDWSELTLASTTDTMLRCEIDPTNTYLAAVTSATAPRQRLYLIGTTTELALSSPGGSTWRSVNFNADGTKVMFSQSLNAFGRVNVYDTATQAASVLETGVASILETVRSPGLALYEYSGFVRDANNAPLQTQVTAIDPETGVTMAQTTSNPSTGAYRMFVRGLINATLICPNPGVGPATLTEARVTPYRVGA
jgi:hypothetical protein